MKRKQNEKQPERKKRMERKKEGGETENDTEQRERT